MLTNFPNTSTTAYLIDLAASCGIYTIISNILYSQGDDASVPIRDIGAAQVGIIADNLYDSAAGDAWAPTSVNILGNNSYGAIPGTGVIGLKY